MVSRNAVNGEEVKGTLGKVGAYMACHERGVGRSTLRCCFRSCPTVPLPQKGN